MDFDALELRGNVQVVELNLPCAVVLVQCCSGSIVW